MFLIQTKLKNFLISFGNFDFNQDMMTIFLLLEKYKVIKF